MIDRSKLWGKLLYLSTLGGKFLSWVFNEGRGGSSERGEGEQAAIHEVSG